MKPDVLIQNLRNARTALLWWGLGVALYSYLVLLIYPSIKRMPYVDQLIENYPKELKALFGMEGLSLATPEGYLNAEFFSFMAPLLFLIFAIGAGAGAIAGEEEAGTLDLLLAQPLSRSRLLWEKFAALALESFVLGLVLWLILWAGSLQVGMDIGAFRLLAASVGVVLLALFHGALALALGAATGKRRLALGLSAALAVGGYLVNALAPLSETLERYQALSPFYQALGYGPLVEGLDPGHAAVLLIAALILTILGLIAFRRRDVAV